MPGPNGICALTYQALEVPISIWLKENVTNQAQKRTNNLSGDGESRLSDSNTADYRAQRVEAHEGKGVNIAHDGRVAFDRLEVDRQVEKYLEVRAVCCGDDDAPDQV
jgi:hypothetical protein